MVGGWVGDLVNVRGGVRRFFFCRPALVVLGALLGGLLNYACLPGRQELFI
jgi:hypothetical protein